MKKVICAILTIIPLASLLGISVAQANVVISQDTNGVNRCFYADSNGSAYGSSLPPSYCSGRTGWAQGANGATSCFYLDANGTAFDYSVDTSICQGSPSNRSDDDYRDHDGGDRDHGDRDAPRDSEGQCYLDRYPDICQNSAHNRTFINKAIASITGILLT